jgi:hypothetical protein
MDDKIKNFLEKWNEMIIASKAIEEFKFEFSISVRSENWYFPQREELIMGVNKSFDENGMKYKSSSSN